MLLHLAALAAPPSLPTDTHELVDGRVLSGPITGWSRRSPHAACPGTDHVLRLTPPDGSAFSVVELATQREGMSTGLVIGWLRETPAGATIPEQAAALGLDAVEPWGLLDRSDDYTRLACPLIPYLPLHPVWSTTRPDIFLIVDGHGVMGVLRGRGSVNGVDYWRPDFPYVRCWSDPSDWLCLSPTAEIPVLGPYNPTHDDPWRDAATALYDLPPSPRRTALLERSAALRREVVSAARDGTPDPDVADLAALDSALARVSSLLDGPRDGWIDPWDDLASAVRSAPQAVVAMRRAEIDALQDRWFAALEAWEQEARSAGAVFTPWWLAAQRQRLAPDAKAREALEREGIAVASRFTVPPLDPESLANAEVALQVLGWSYTRIPAEVVTVVPVEVRRAAFETVVRGEKSVSAEVPNPALAAWRKEIEAVEAEIAEIETEMGRIAGFAGGDTFRAGPGLTAKEAQTWTESSHANASLMNSLQSRLANAWDAHTRIRLRQPSATVLRDVRVEETVPATCERYWVLADVLARVEHDGIEVDATGRGSLWLESEDHCRHGTRTDLGIVGRDDLLSDDELRALAREDQGVRMAGVHAARGAWLTAWLARQVAEGSPPLTGDALALELTLIRAQYGSNRTWRVGPREPLGPGREERQGEGRTRLVTLPGADATGLQIAADAMKRTGMTRTAELRRLCEKQTWRDLMPEVCSGVPLRIDLQPLVGSEPWMWAVCQAHPDAEPCQAGWMRARALMETRFGP